MKLIHLKNLKRECVLVELPEITIRVNIWENFITAVIPYAYRLYYSNRCPIIELPLGRYQEIGHFPSLTDQDFGSLVDYYHIGENMDLTSNFAYKDYKDGIEEQDNVDYDYWDEYACNTARESFLSAVEAQGWHVNGNPFGEEPEHNEEEDDDLVGAVLSVRRREAQEKVVDLSRCYLFLKEVDNE